MAHNGMNSNGMLTFGKYKGEHVSIILADESYINFIRPWIGGKYPDVYNFVFKGIMPTPTNVVVNQMINANANSKTPEHNKIQNMFLDKEDVSKRLGRVIGYPILATKIEFEGQCNWDVIVQGKILIKCRPNTYGNCKICSILCKSLDDPDSSPTLHDIEFFIEIKPTLDNDYPCVLRKMKSQIKQTTIKSGCFQENLLLVKEFNSTSTSMEQLKQIFGQTNIRVAFLEGIPKSELEILKERNLYLEARVKELEEKLNQ